MLQGMDVRADEKLTAFLELEAAMRASRRLVLHASRVARSALLTK